MKNFINQYLAKGFGSMNKNDFEVMIMHWLLQNRLSGKSNYEISRELKISESKVKRLIYEASLKYDEDEKSQNDRLVSVLKRVHIYGEKDEVMFFVEDLSTRSYLMSLLKKEGRIGDYRLNDEIVVLKSNDFFSLLDKLFSDTEKQRIIKQASFHFYRNTEAKGFKELMQDIFNRIVDRGKDKVADLTIEGIIKLIVKLALLM